MEHQVNQPDARPRREPDDLAAERVGSGSMPIQPLKLPVFPDPSNQLAGFVGGDRQAEQRPDPTTAALELVSTARLSPVRKLVWRSGVAIAPVRQVLMQLVPKQWSWTLIWICVLGVFGGMGTSAFLWLASLPPLPDCKKISLLSPEVQRFYCAQEIARSGQFSDLAAGIALLKGWSKDQPLYEDAQHSIDEWSALILVKAREKMMQSDLEGAVAVANAVPQSSSVHQEAQKAIAAWQIQWQQGEAIYAKALKAMQAQNWKEASYLVSDLGQINHDYWRLQKADILSKQIALEKQSRNALTQAQKLVKDGNPDQIGAAIALAQQVAPNTQVWAEAQTVLQQWSQELIAMGLQHWERGDVAGAVAIAQQVPLDQSLPAAASDLVRFGYAQKLVEESETSWEPTWAQVWAMLEAVTAVEQIPAESPIHAQAQVKVQGWQMQLQDLMQLQFASLVAGLGNPASLEFAIGQAQRVPPHSSRRAQAQTLAAHWKQAIARLEDRPYLLRAEAMAESGTVSALQRAIAQAKVIPTERAAWFQAQEWIAKWTGQIQTIEDQPIWNRAQALAKQKKLPEAIDLAATIRPNRALYPQAQAAIEQWRSTIRAAEIAEDQPILDQANALAARTRLTMAIEMASQIAAGRALYDEAQASIKLWLEQRDKIWAEQPSQPTETDSGFGLPSAQEPGSNAASPSDPEAHPPDSSEAVPGDSADSFPATDPPVDGAAEPPLN